MTKVELEQRNIERFHMAMERKMYRFDRETGKIYGRSPCRKFWVELKGADTDKGYKRYAFYWKPGKAVKVLGHRAIWLAAGNDIEPGYEIHHKDLDKAHNWLDNLMTTTTKGHSLLHEKKKPFKLTPEPKLIDIYCFWQQGMSSRQIGKKLEVDINTVTDLIEKMEQRKTFRISKNFYDLPEIVAIDNQKKEAIQVCVDLLNNKTSHTEVSAIEGRSTTPHSGFSESSKTS